jgi:hypothetical protein
VIAAGAFLIISATLGVVSSKRFSERNALEEQLTAARSNLQQVQMDGLAPRQKELESQLRQSTSQFESIKSILSRPVRNVAANSILFDVAEAYDLEVTEITSPGSYSDNLEGVTCSVMPLGAKVEGELPYLISFLIKLNTYFTTGVIQSITITIPEEISEEKASADIQLIVYTYQGE